ncbi:MAG: ATP synthase F1 subunit epsilon [Anaerolineaceae bacterium]|nr:ATP synthase F1 subunit epsilon [Anaerolineaceae bacterium]MDE0329390.1 ATP synthase F1 subunit epsilon [Anaerolineaceae bacterium]
MTIHVEVVTQERKVFEEPEADIVVLPGSEGEMGVLPRHAPLLTTMGYGELIVRKGPAEERFAIYGGVVDVRPDKVVVLADLAESSFNLDIRAIEEARESAARMLQEGVPEDQNREAQLALRRAELGARIHRRIQGRGSVLRILDQDAEDAE